MQKHSLNRLIHRLLIFVPERHQRVVFGIGVRGVRGATMHPKLNKAVNAPAHSHKMAYLGVYSGAVYPDLSSRANRCFTYAKRASEPPLGPQTAFAPPDCSPTPSV